MTAVSEGLRKAVWGVGATLVTAAVVWSFTWLTETRALAAAAKSAVDNVDVVTNTTHITLRKDFEHADEMITAQLKVTNDNLEKTNEGLGELRKAQQETRDTVNKAITILERMERKL